MKTPRQPRRETIILPTWVALLTKTLAKREWEIQRDSCQSRRGLARIIARLKVSLTRDPAPGQSSDDLAETYSESFNDTIGRALEKTYGYRMVVTMVPSRRTLLPVIEGVLFESFSSKAFREWTFTPYGDLRCPDRDELWRDPLEHRALSMCSPVAEADRRLTELAFQVAGEVRKVAPMFQL